MVCIGFGLSSDTSITCPIANIFLPPSGSASPLQMGGLDGVRRREATMLTLQTLGSKGIMMFMRPRDEEGS